jgi:hypothetical protein
LSLKQKALLAVVLDCVEYVKVVGEEREKGLVLVVDGGQYVTVRNF